MVNKRKVSFFSDSTYCGGTHVPYFFSQFWTCSNITTVTQTFYKHLLRFTLPSTQHQRRRRTRADQQGNVEEAGAQKESVDCCAAPVRASPISQGHSGRGIGRDENALICPGIRYEPRTWPPRAGRWAWIAYKQGNNQTVLTPPVQIGA